MAMLAAAWPGAASAQNASAGEIYQGVSWPSGEVRELTLTRPGADPLGEPEEIRITIGQGQDVVGAPVQAIVRHRRASRTLQTTTAPSGSLAGLTRLPVTYSRMTSTFGLRRHPLLGGWRVHSGVDLAAPTGTPVYAEAAATVSRGGWRGGYGLSLSLDHPGGIETRYGHLSRLNVSAGQQVKQGDLIGYVGSTGRSTGPHLHYEVRVNGGAVNPLTFNPSRRRAASAAPKVAAAERPVSAQSNWKSITFPKR